jgi:hypothetical protein
MAMMSRIASPVKHYPYPIELSTESMIAPVIAAPIFLRKLDRVISAGVEGGMQPI